MLCPVDGGSLMRRIINCWAIRAIACLVLTTTAVVLETRERGLRRSGNGRASPSCGMRSVPSSRAYKPHAEISKAPPP